MKLYAQLKLMGFFAWLKDTHEVPFPSDDDITELDNTPADDIGAVALRAMVFKYFRDEHRYNGETPFLINIDKYGIIAANMYVKPKNLSPEENLIRGAEVTNNHARYNTREEAEVACILRLIEIVNQL